MNNFSFIEKEEMRRVKSINQIEWRTGGCFWVWERKHQMPIVIYLKNNRIDHFFFYPHGCETFHYIHTDYVIEYTDRRCLHTDGRIEK